MNKWLYLLLILLSCKFEFESPYEDVNGIYVQWVKTYSNYGGEKLVIEGEYGYLLDPSTLTKYNFANIDSIYVISKYCDSLWIADFEVSQNFAYLAVTLSGLSIVNFQGIDAILYGHVDIPGHSYIVKVQGNQAYVGSDSSLYIVDVSDKTDPQIISSCHFTHKIECIAVDSHYAYVLLKNYDFFIMDIQQPEEPEIIIQKTIDEASLFALNGMYLYFHIPYYDQLHTYEITDAGSIEYITSFNLPSITRFLYVGETYGLASDFFDVYLINFEYSARPCVSEVLEGRSSYYGVVEGDYIYLLRLYLEIFEIKEVQE
jgi:hypothetical protein